MATLTLYKIPTNEHGCKGETVTVRQITRRKGVVETVAVCDCVGCSRLVAGEVVSLPASFDGTWQQAAQADFRCDQGFAQATMVTPDTLLTGFTIRTNPSHVA